MPARIDVLNGRQVNIPGGCAAPVGRPVHRRIANQYVLAWSTTYHSVRRIHFPRINRCLKSFPSHEINPDYSRDLKFLVQYTSLGKLNGIEIRLSSMMFSLIW